MKTATAKYIEFMPKTIGLRVYRYGPVVTNFFERGLISTLKISVGPPFPILSKSIFDQTTNINPKTNKIKPTENRITSDLMMIILK